MLTLVVYRSVASTKNLSQGAQEALPYEIGL